MSAFRLRMAGALALLLLVQGVAQAQWVWTPQTRRWINLKRLPKETAELQVEYARSLMIEGDYSKALHETEKFQQFYADSPQADENQFVRGEILLARAKYLDAAKEFQQVVVNFPDTDLYDEVIEKQYEIGDRLYELGQKRYEARWQPFRRRPLKYAGEVYTMVIDNQPFTDEAAEAQYKMGLCHFTREQYTEALYEYRQVVEKYSSSDWVDDASYGLIQCHYNSALPPDYDQVPSRLAVNAIDDFKASFPRDERLDGLEEKRQEMVESIATQRLKTAQFYEKRREFQAARIYYAVVVEQFPDTAAAEEARAWLTDSAHQEAAG